MKYLYILLFIAFTGCWSRQATVQTVCRHPVDSLDGINEKDLWRVDISAYCPGTKIGVCKKCGQFLDAYVAGPNSMSHFPAAGKFRDMFMQRYSLEALAASDKKLSDATDNLIKSMNSTNSICVISNAITSRAFGEILAKAGDRHVLVQGCTIDADKN